MAKKKDRKLTAQEAIAFAKAELAPFWIHSEPLFAYVKKQNQSTLYPLNQEFNDKYWLFVFLDPLAFSTVQVLTLIKEYNRRYHVHGLNFIFVISSPYLFLFKINEIETVLHQLGFKCPVFIDKDGSIAATLKAFRFPCFVVVDQGEVTLSENGFNNLSELEDHIQKTLRKKDPGLPFLKWFILNFRETIDMSPIHFGLSQGVEFPKPGFKKTDKGAWEAVFKKGNPINGFEIEGKWQHDQDKIVAINKDCSLTIETSGTDVSVICRTVTSDIDLIPRVDVLMNDKAIQVQNQGSHLVIDDDGKSYFKIDKHRVFHLLCNLRQPVKLELKFINSEIKPTEAYGLRFAKMKPISRE